MATNVLDIQEIVRDAVLKVDRTVQPEEVAAGTSLVDELGLDSGKLIDLAFALEDALDVTELPIMTWYDTERSHEPPRFTVASLADACRRWLDQQGPRK